MKGLILIILVVSGIYFFNRASKTKRNAEKDKMYYERDYEDEFDSEFEDDSNEEEINDSDDSCDSCSDDD